MKIILFLLSITLISGCSPRLTSTSPDMAPEIGWLWTAHWHPNKARLAVGGTQDTLRIFSTKNHQLLQNYPMKGTITQVQWHPTQNKLAIAMQGGTARTSILNLDSNKRIELDSVNDFGARAIGWNSNGQRLAVGDYDGMITIFDDAGKKIKRIATHQKSIIGLDWHPSKDIIIAVGDRISIYDLKADTLYHVEDRKEGVLMLCVEWHPSGDFFVTGDYGDFEHPFPPLLQFWTADGEKIKTIETSKAEFRALKWTEDGALLATASENIRLWDKNGNLVSEKPCPDLLWGIDWNQKGNKLATTDKKGSIVVWNRNLKQWKSLKY